MRSNFIFYFKRTVAVLLCSIGFLIADAQQFSTWGTDFWTAYAPSFSMYKPGGAIRTDGGSQQMVFYFSAPYNANVTVEIPALGWTRTYAVSANVVLESDAMPDTGNMDARIDSEGVFNTGIHITSDQPVFVDEHIFTDQSSATTMLIPTTLLGQNYTAITYTQQSDGPNSNAFCFVVAAEDSTTIVFTPVGNTLTHLSKVPIVITLNKGQVFNVFGASNNNNTAPYTGVDLTGTRIETEAYSASSGCKPIAVFTGSTSLSLNCNQSVSTSDNTVQQNFPQRLAGREFIAIPPKNFSSCFYRILVYDTGTVVTRNNVVLTNLIKGKWYDIETSEPSVFLSNKNISVVQLFTSSNECGNTDNNGNGDPEMTFLLPAPEDLESVVFNSPPQNNLTDHYVNVVKQKDSALIFLDNTDITSTFIPLIYDTSYEYTRLPVSAGSHTLYSDSAFFGMAYGFGPNTSYAYNLGFVFIPRSPKLETQNPYLTDTLGRTCRATPFKLSIILHYIPVSIKWDFLGNSNLSPNDFTDMLTPVYDSLYYVDSVPSYRFTLPDIFMVNNVQDIPILITLEKYTVDGCTDTAVYNLNLQLFQKPLADWITNDNACENNALHFNDASQGFSLSFIKWFWNFDNGNKDSTQDPTQSFAAGNYNISLRSVNNIGCYADTVKPIFISSIPKANYSFAGNYCVGNNIYFSDSSTIATGTINQWFWDFGDGQTSSEQDPVIPFFTADSLNVSLHVATPQGCVSDTVYKPLIIYPYPTITTPYDTFVVAGNSVQLRPTYTGTSLQYLWTPSLYLNNDSIAFPYSDTKTSTFYEVQVTGAGNCISKSSIYIYVIQFLEIPNVFSPNGDGTNDKWIIKNIERYPNASVQIFNRYGQPVFISTGYYSPWDGTYLGKPLPVGTYYYLIDTKSKYIPISSGNVTILR